MARRLIDVDPLTGLQTWHDYDASTGLTALTYSQDVEAFLDENKAADNHARPSRYGNMVHAASIPASVQMIWLTEKGIDVLNPDHKQAVAKLLDDPEWKYLKRLPITLGRV